MRKYHSLCHVSSITTPGAGEKTFFPLTGNEETTTITRDGDYFTIVDTRINMVREIHASQVRYAVPESIPVPIKKREAPAP